MKQLNPYSSRAERLIMVVILINSAIILLLASGFSWPWLLLIELLCSFIFIVEMALKMRYDGFLGYWRKGWNILDGSLVLLSLPSIPAAFLPITDISFILILRLLRAFRFFRVIHFFPGAAQIGRNFRKALSESLSLFVGYFIVILISALLSTSLFGQAAPQFFANPLDSIYSIFRLFSTEGWYEIPDAVAAAYGPWGVHGVRIYFIVLLILGGVIGLSLINSVFVDAMVSDNNDEVLARLKRLEEKIDAMNKDK
ncbi:MAG: ion transporter [Bacteroidaceae bacterium]|nr:ion transporter [Bacteroidaceae bacterium]